MESCEFNIGIGGNGLDSGILGYKTGYHDFIIWYGKEDKFSNIILDDLLKRFQKKQNWNSIENEISVLYQDLYDNWDFYVSKSHFEEQLSNEWDNLLLMEYKNSNNINSILEINVDEFVSYIKSIILEMKLILSIYLRNTTCKTKEDHESYFTKVCDYFSSFEMYMENSILLTFNYTNIMRKDISNFNLHGVLELPNNISFDGELFSKVPIEYESNFQKKISNLSKQKQIENTPTNSIIYNAIDTIFRTYNFCISKVESDPNYFPINKFVVVGSTIPKSDFGEKNSTLKNLVFRGFKVKEIIIVNLWKFDELSNYKDQIKRIMNLFIGVENIAGPNTITQSFGQMENIGSFKVFNSILNKYYELKLFENIEETLSKFEWTRTTG